MVVKHAIFSVSLATLLFLPSWDQIEQLPRFAFYTKDFVSRTELISTLVPTVLLLALAIFFAVRLILSTGNQWVFSISRAFLLLILYIPLRQANLWLEPQRWQALTVRATGIVLLAAAAFTLIRRSKLPSKLATAFVFVAAPLLPILVFHFAFSPHPPLQAWRDRPLSPLHPSAIPYRIVYVVFDEWDRYLTFERRPASIQLPALDRFRQIAIDVARTSSPSTFTRTSVPSLLTGSLVKTAEERGPDEFAITFADGATEILGKGSNLFRRVRELGGNTAVTGWYLPYCRVLGQDLNSCYWEAMRRPDRLLAAGPGRWHRIALEQWRPIFQALPFANRVEFSRPLTDLESRQWMRGIIERLSDHAQSQAADPRLNLVVLHLPIPHGPAVFDRHRGQFSVSSSRDYLDELVLLDHTLSRLRAAMERSGTWDSSAVLLTSDHPFRVESQEITAEERRVTGGKMHPYVPFLLKMPGQRQGASEEGPFANVLSADLILAILNGELKDFQDALSWLARHSGGNQEQRHSFAHALSPQ